MERNINQFLLEVQVGDSWFEKQQQMVGMDKMTEIYVKEN